MDKTKNSISRIAVRNGWPLDQIQYAEDYIDALVADKATARRPIGLRAGYARTARERYNYYNRTT